MKVQNQLGAGQSWLPRAGHPTKMKKRRVLLKEGRENPMVTLSELQRSCELGEKDNQVSVQHSISLGFMAQWPDKASPE